MMKNLTIGRSELVKVKRLMQKEARQGKQRGLCLHLHLDRSPLLSDACAWPDGLLANEA